MRQQYLGSITPLQDNRIEWMTPEKKPITQPLSTVLCKTQKNKQNKTNKSTSLYSTVFSH